MEFLLNERCIFVFVFIFCTIHNHWMFAANVDDKNFNKILTISEFDHYDSEIGMFILLSIYHSFTNPIEPNRRPLNLN